MNMSALHHRAIYLWPATRLFAGAGAAWTSAKRRPRRWRPQEYERPAGASSCGATAPGCGWKPAVAHMWSGCFSLCSGKPLQAALETWPSSPTGSPPPGCGAGAGVSGLHQSLLTEGSSRSGRKGLGQAHLYASRTGSRAFGIPTSGNCLYRPSFAEDDLPLGALSQ